MDDKISYYKIHDLNLIGKMDNRVCYIYNKDNGWIIDNNRVLLDRLIGYDETEESGSPYKLGNMDMMSRIDKITKDEAMRLINKLT